jgi:hypothetical protein
VTKLLAVLVVFVACAGPRAPLEVGTKEFPVNILLGGSPAAPLEAPPATGTQDPPPLAFGGGPFITNGPAPASPSVAACPDYHPFAAPKTVATNRVATAPVAGTYPFRNSGSAGYPPQTQRIVGDVNPKASFGADPATAFSVSENVNGRVTTVRYLTVTRAASDGDSGIYVTKIETTERDGTRNGYEPRSPLKVLEFPAEPGKKWTTATSDPLTATVVTLDAGTIVAGNGVQPEKLRINACGEPIDAWAVKLRWRTVTPSSDVTQDILVAYPPQFGGFSVHDDVTTYPTANPDSAVRNIATINVVPPTA